MSAALNIPVRSAGRRSRRMLVWTGVSVGLVAALGSGGYPPGANAEVDLAKVLVGRWEGDVQVVLGERERRLVITGVQQVEDKWVALGQFGLPRLVQEKPSRVFKIPLLVDGDRIILDVRTLGGDYARLRLEGENVLRGTLTFKGLQRMHDIKLLKVLAP